MLFAKKKKVSFIMCSRKDSSCICIKKEFKRMFEIFELMFRQNGGSTEDLLQLAFQAAAFRRVYWREIKIFAHHECK